MKEKLIVRSALTGIALMLSAGVFAVDGIATGQLAGTNPEFIRWMRSRNPRASHVSEAVESEARAVGAAVSRPTVCSVSVVPKSNGDLPAQALGYIPPTIDFGYLQDCRKVAGQMPLVRSHAAVSLPARYDLRDENRVTSVKDQGNYGTCWAHATLGSLESLLLGAGRGTFNFSEKHLANLHGRDWGFSEGGNGDVAIAYLARMSGPIAESEDPYPDNSYYQKWNRRYNGDSSHIRELTVSPSPVGTVLKHALNAEMLTPMEDGADTEALAAIKEAVRTYGAVYCGYTHVWGAFDGTTFYWNGNNSVVDSRGGGGHAVLIVGWDDNYSKSNFKYTPPGNGAFIVKNSWGTSNGESGYNYFSYYDKTFAKGEIWSFQTCTDTNDYVGVYSYDPLGRVTQYGKGDTVAYGANMFVAKEDETLSAVGIYANAPNTSYVIDIYTNCTSKTSPVTGVKATTQSGTSACGYFTIPLSSPVPVKSGVRFSVVVRLSTPGCYTPLAVEYYQYYTDYILDPSGNRYDYYGYFTDGSGEVFTDESGTLYAHFYDEEYLCVLNNGRWYYTGILWTDCTVHRVDLTSKATASRGESFVSANGTTWADLTVDFDSSANFCCKVYTTETPKQTEPVKSATPTNLAASLADDKSYISLSWSYGYPQSVFQVYRSTNSTRPGNWYKQVLDGSTGLADTSIAQGTTYYYWVAAKRFGEDYLFSDPVGPVVVTVPEAGPPPKPDLAFYTFADKKWTEPLFLTSDYGGVVPKTSFREGDAIYLNCGVLNIGEAAANSSFISSFEMFDANGSSLGKYENSNAAGLKAGTGFFWSNFQWSRLSNLSPGSYFIRATLDVDDDVDESDEDNNIRDLPFTVVSGLTIAEGVDMPSAEFSTGGSAGWYGHATDNAVNGGDVARSGTLQAGGTSWLETSFSGSGVVEVKYWSTSGISLDIAADGGETTVVVGGDVPSGWTMYRTHFSSSGTHTIRWSVTAATAGAYAFLDDMKWSAAPLPGKPEIVRVVHRTGGSQNWVELEYYPPDSLTAVQSVLYRSTSRTGVKTEVAATYSFPNFTDSTAGRGVAYWYWVCASNQYGAVWSDPVRTGWGLVDPTWTQPIEIPAAGTNMNIKIDAPWIAQSLDPWLTVTYKSSAKSESCEFSASPNSAGQSRPGTLRVIRYPGETYCHTNDYIIVQGWDAPASDFTIVNGCVTGYTGSGGDIVIPSTDPTTGDAVTNIANSAFYQNKTITSVVIPDSVVSIGTEAFRQCRNMTSVTLGAGLKVIGGNAFRTADSLVRLALPDSLETIGQYAFAECSSLEDIDFGHGVYNIMGWAFMSCKKLTVVSFPESLRYIGRSMMDACHGLQEATFADGVTNISRTCFNNCKALSSVYIPGTVSRIEQSAFYGCTNLTVVSMAEGLGVIEQNAFSTCSGMRSITIPASVTNIEAHAFLGCSTLTNVMYKGNAPTVVVDIYENALNVVSYVTALSTGWGGDGLDWPVDGLFPVSNVESKQQHRRPIVRGDVYEVTPAAPVILSCVGDEDGIVLTWGGAARAMTYSVYRSTTAICPRSPIAAGIEATCFTNDTCEAGVDYWYWVSAVNNGGEAVCAVPATAWRRYGAKITHDAVEISHDGGVVDVVVNANAPWTAVKSGDWLSMTRQGEGLNATLGFTAEKNTLPDIKPGSVEITVGGDGVHAATVYTLPVTQAAAPSGQVATPVITPGDGSTFEEVQTVEITCATPGAVIYYTVDGKTPRPTAPFRYGGPFEIDRSVEVCAFADCEGLARSSFAEAVLTKVVPDRMTLAGSVELAGEDVSTDDMDGWAPVADTSAVGGSCARSGEIGMLAESRMTWRVSGAGTVTFSWRSDCEADPRGRYSYDYGAFTVDGVETNHIDGVTSWAGVSVKLEGDGEHVLTWTYHKDGFDETKYSGEDCVWVDNVAWTPADVTIDIGGGRSLVIPLSWFEAYYPGGADAYGYASYAEVAMSASGKSDGRGNPLKVWQDFVAGTDPTDADSVFKVTSFKYENGKITITWDPDLNESGSKSERVYRTYGAETPSQDNWNLIETDTPSPKYKFFTVEVDMP